MENINNFITDFYNKNKLSLECSYPGIKPGRLKQEFVDFAKIHHEVITSPEFWGANHPFTKFFKSVDEGIPLQYITGKAAFYNHEFEVGPEVLIPRSETETLVELALKELKKIEGIPEVLDVGTGSGIIILSLLGEMTINGIATDICEKALNIAKLNFFKLNHGLKEGEIDFIKADRLSGIENKFHLIISNPPYIKKEENLKSVHPQVRKYEPSKALFLNDEEYEDWYSTFFKDSLNHLHDGGVFLMEGHELHLDNLKELAQKIGFKDVQILKDLAQQKRYLKAYGQINN